MGQCTICVVTILNLKSVQSGPEFSFRVACIFFLSCGAWNHVNICAPAKCISLIQVTVMLDLNENKF